MDASQRDTQRYQRATDTSTNLDRAIAISEISWVRNFTVRHASRSVEIVFPACRPPSPSRPVEPASSASQSDFKCLVCFIKQEIYILISLYYIRIGCPGDIVYVSPDPRTFGPVMAFVTGLRAARAKGRAQTFQFIFFRTPLVIPPSLFWLRVFLSCLRTKRGERTGARRMSAPSDSFNMRRILMRPHGCVTGERRWCPD